ncbi:hypothetical protein [Methylobacterium sp. WCS2018Hpa-22]|uniref:hypothetical protein n=1 Tax=Methylobacterium sp. WCS2018Hpa-22 TaxID=3073633 RepID=UPI00288A80B0|nr:hypothetical protein [Methylobacterium sp. WCS2018Hpa-22]
MKFLATPGVVVGVMAAAGGIANACGYPALGLFLSDPSTAVTATSVIVGVATLAAGLLRGVKKPAA